MSAEPTQPAPPCSTHPDAPHGFDRDGSHTAGRYVCDCEGWIPPQPEPEATCPECIRGAVPMFDGHGNEIGLGHCEACDGFGFQPKPDPQPPTDTERANAFEWLCTKCGERGMPWTHVTYEETHDGCGGACQSVPIKPEPHQSAVEWWVRRMILPESDGPVDFSPEHLPSPLALELAERCDAAEKLVTATAQDLRDTARERNELLEQLAAAQAEIQTLKNDLAETQETLSEFRNAYRYNL